MYISDEKYPCEKCLISYNKIKLEEWILKNPDIQLKWEGSRPDLALKLKNAGYYGWEKDLPRVTTLMADCHGDSLSLCKKHMLEFIEENWT